MKCVWFSCFQFSILLVVFVFKQKTAYEMRISDWSSDVCSSDLRPCSAACAASSVASTIGVPTSCAARCGAIGAGKAVGLIASRSEERRVGKEGVSTCRSRGSAFPEKKKRNLQSMKGTCLAQLLMILQRIPYRFLIDKV